MVAQYQRLVRRRGKYKAIVAVMHSVWVIAGHCRSLPVIAYHVRHDQRPYHDLGADYFDRLESARLERQYVRRLEQLGYTVTLTPSSVA